jgi:hypothetical protein
MKMVSDKQLEANKQNAKKGGVKTEEGKEIVKYNAMKRSRITTAYQKDTEISLIYPGVLCRSA